MRNREFRCIVPSSQRDGRCEQAAHRRQQPGAANRFDSEKSKGKGEKRSFSLSSFPLTSRKSLKMNSMFC